MYEEVSREAGLKNMLADRGSIGSGVDRHAQASIEQLDMNTVTEGEVEE
jgi:hypothetical protein